MFRNKKIAVLLGKRILDPISFILFYSPLISPVNNKVILYDRHS